MQGVWHRLLIKSYTQIFIMIEGLLFIDAFAFAG